jgi:hexosaminidase
VNTLRSEFDPTNRSITLELDLAEPLMVHGRLALTSIVQLTPAADSGARLTRQLASYHELSPSSDLAPGETWTITDLQLSHLPNHANDGPVSAFLIRSDGSTSPVEVEPMRRTGVGDARQRLAEDPPVGSPEERAELALVPYPTQLVVDEPAPSGNTSASFGSGPDAACAAWDAIVALDRRAGGARLIDQGAAVVSGTLAPQLAAEEFRLVIDGGSIHIAASGASGFRHGLVTLAQWLECGLPSRASVADTPRYPFRGLHVDLARQWFEPDVVMRLIDAAAWRKLSHLHLHLTDDEAWRVPVEAFPELAAVAGVRGHGLPLPPMLGGGPGPVGRAYTPDEIAGWVARADALGVVLVPEVDLPAHMHAALTALPGLRDPGDASGARSVQYYTDNVLVPGRGETSRFVECVVDAIAELFPNSPTIHIGGDEVASGAWSGSPIVAAFMRERGLPNVDRVEATFHRDVVRTIRERSGRRIAAWQEAAESGGVAPGDGYVVGWRTVEASRELAARGFDVVVSPGQAYYLDMAIDDDWSTPGASWAGHTSLERVCEFDPEQGWSYSERAHLLGVQACIWTETVHDEQTLNDFLFPRLDAIAERAWTGRIVGGVRSLVQRATVAAGRPEPAQRACAAAPSGRADFG